MQVTRITPTVSTAARAPEATAAGSGARSVATGFDRAERLEAIRSEMRNAVAFTAKAHHGWGGPDPAPVPTLPAPTPGPVMPAE